MYLPEAVLVLIGFSKSHEVKIVNHLHKCKGVVPLIIFEELDDVQLIAASNLKSKITSWDWVNRIDTIFITQYKFNTSIK